MFIHMFAFRWKPEATQAQKDRAAAEIRAFQGQIAGLAETAVGVNQSARGGGYELGGVMKFTDQAAFEAYNDAPQHQALLGWLVPLIEAVEIDFTV
ncbi:Stress responsive A/B Barrel Domain protein [Sphingomonas paucimobilis]|nr:Stress responsive A/B Barrel Domain protein [Sphingomonas paucimobilis]